MWCWALTMVLLAATLLTRAWESPDSPMQNPLGWGTLRRIYFESCRPRDSGYSLGKPEWGKSGGWIERSMLLYWNSPAWDRGRASHKRVRKPIWLKAYVPKGLKFWLWIFWFLIFPKEHTVRPRDSLKGLGQRTSLYHFKLVAHYRTTQSVVQYKWNLCEYIYTYMLRGSLIPPLVKNLPSVKDTLVRFLGQEDLLKKG